MKQEKTMPIYGVGPIYVYGILLLDVIGILLSHLGFIPILEQGVFRIPCIILGMILIITNAFIWVKAAVLSKLVVHIKEDELVTDGIYAYMRNPIYSAFSFALFGLLLIYGNIILLPLILIDWAFLTVLMKNTEEKWLYEAFGQEYIAYCKKVNRFFPWFSQK